MSEDKGTPIVEGDLTQKINAVKSLTSLHDLLSRGHFDGYLADRIIKAQAFVASLHSQMIKDIPEEELAKALEALKVEAAS